MISCKQLNVGIGRKTILSDVSLSFSNGTITALLGENGSGKTSLLRTLSGGLQIKNGKVEIDGIDREKFTEAIKATKISLLPQHFPMPAITVERLVEYGRTPYMGYAGILRAEDRNIVKHSLERTDLMELKDKLVCHLSGGERQMAFFAMSLAQNCPNLLLDEPLSGLDTKRRRLLLQLLQEEKESGKMILLSIHSLEDAMEIADRMVVLDQKKLVFDGSKEEFVQSKIVSQVFDREAIPVIDMDQKEYWIFR